MRESWLSLLLETSLELERHRRIVYLIYDIENITAVDMLGSCYFDQGTLPRVPDLSCKYPRSRSSELHSIEILTGGYGSSLMRITDLITCGWSRAYVKDITESYMLWACGKQTINLIIKAYY
jgi:hypothetical protein